MPYHVAELRRGSIGPDLVFGQLWRETGCGEVINGLLAGRRFGFDVERAIYLTVLRLLMVSGSDRHASRWHYLLVLASRSPPCCCCANEQTVS
jgi:hypothetical protein